MSHIIGYTNYTALLLCPRVSISWLEYLLRFRFLHKNKLISYRTSKREHKNAYIPRTSSYSWLLCLLYRFQYLRMSWLLYPSSCILWFHRLAISHTIFNVVKSPCHCYRHITAMSWDERCCSLVWYRWWYNTWRCSILFLAGNSSFLSVHQK